MDWTELLRMIRDSYSGGGQQRTGVSMWDQQAGRPQSQMPAWGRQYFGGMQQPGQSVQRYPMKNPDFGGMGGWGNTGSTPSNGGVLPRTGMMTQESGWVNTGFAPSLGDQSPWNSGNWTSAPSTQQSGQRPVSGGDSIQYPAALTGNDLLSRVKQRNSKMDYSGIR